MMHHFYAKAGHAAAQVLRCVPPTWYARSGPSVTSIPCTCSQLFSVHNASTITYFSRTLTVSIRSGC